MLMLVEDLLGKRRAELTATGQSDVFVFSDLTRLFINFDFPI